MTANSLEKGARDGLRANGQYAAQSLCHSTIQSIQQRERLFMGRIAGEQISLEAVIDSSGYSNKMKWISGGCLPIFAWLRSHRLPTSRVRPTIEGSTDGWLV